jgi:hypothetical protein
VGYSYKVPKVARFERPPSSTFFAIGPNKTGEGGKAASPSPAFRFYRL